MRVERDEVFKPGCIRRRQRLVGLVGGDQRVRAVAGRYLLLTVRRLRSRLRRGSGIIFPHMIRFFELLI